MLTCGVFSLKAVKGLTSFAIFACTTVFVLRMYNKETIQLLDTDPQLHIVISAVAFSNGQNSKSLLVSLSLGFGLTFNESWQEKGRVGRDPNTVGGGVILAHRRVVKEVESYLAYKCCKFDEVKTLALTLINAHIYRCFSVSKQEAVEEEIQID
jgi:hypothetical protein